MKISGQVPDSPENFYISIIPISGNTIFSWTQGDISDVDGYSIGFYHEIQHGYMPVDTILGAEISQRIWDKGYGKLKPKTYAINALNYDPELDSLRASKWSDSCTAVWISEIKLDDCTNTVNISWTPYKGWHEDLESYTIYRNYEPYDTVALEIT